MKTSISARSRYILFSLLAIFILACASNKPTLLTFEYLPAVYEHEYIETEAKVYLINDQESYNALLGQLKMRQQDRDEYSEYWSNNTLLLVYGGTRPSSGYYIQTDTIISSAKKLEVFATLTEPGANCMVADVISYPVQLLAIPKTNYSGDIKLVMKSTSKPCR